MNANSDRPGRLKFGVIGAGAVGRVMASALAGAGHELVGVSRSSNDELVLAMLPNVALLEPAEIVAQADLVVLALPQEEIVPVSEGLAALGAWKPGQLVLHTNAALGVAALAAAVASGAIPLAIHPAIAFSGTSLDLRALAGAYAGVSASNAVLPIAQALAVELGLEPQIIAEADRAAYGEAVAVASDFSREIVRQSGAALQSIGVNEPGRFLSVLIHQAVERALTEADFSGEIEPLSE